MIDTVIDISHWNIVTDWAAVAASGVLGVIAKASQGLSYVDPMYAAYRQGALDAGLLWGAYHFGECGAPREQAQHFLATVQPTPTDLLVLDFEPCGATMLTAEADIFVREIWQQTGVCPGLYAGQSFLDECMQGATWSQLSPCFLWIARYSTAAPQVPTLWPTWTLWQYSCEETIPGISGMCDRNRFNGSVEQLYRLWGVADNNP